MARISIDSLIGNDGPNYSEIIVTPYREELTSAGFEQMLTPDDVDKVLNRNDDKTVLVVLNSVCGCSARVARPGTLLSLFNPQVPDIRATLFAGMEKEAVAHFREKYLKGLTPSSPNIAVFKNGQLLHILHRYQIETKSAGDIAAELVAVYNRESTKKNSEEEISQLRQLFIEKYKADPLKSATQ